MQSQIFGLVLMSTAIVQYGVVPLVADFNSTHATNLSWPAHARFHVVTQALSSAAIACVAMFLLWSPSIDRQIGVCLATVLSTCVLGAFFISMACRSLYGGELSDSVSGIAKSHGIDLNALNFGLASAALIIGRLLI
jgi:hypothetical protein